MCFKKRTDVTTEYEILFMKIKNKLSYLIAFAALNQALSFLPMIPQAFYYLIMALGFIFVLAKKPVKVNFLVFLFIIAAITSLLVNDVPPLFSANERLLIFVLISSVAGPLLNSPNIFLFRNQIFCVINRILILLSALSFVTYLLGIAFPWSGTGASSGFFNHSLMLGPLAAVSLLILVYIKIDFMKLRMDIKYKKYINLLILLVFLALLVSSSRSSILGFGAGLLFLIYKINQNKFGKLISAIFKIVLIMLISSPIWFSYTEGIRQKMEYSDSQGGLASSRNAHWDARLYEFNSSPLFGIGFATADIKSPLAIGINEQTGGLEPGSSWIAILAMTGVFGFVVIVLLFVYLFVFLWRDKNNLSKSGILGALLLFFGLHMGAEGYFLAAGSFLFFYIWLLLGVILGYKQYAVLKVI